MSDYVTFYDSIIEELNAQDNINVLPFFARVQVERGQVDAAHAIITDAGGVISGVNPHEAGVTITFHASEETSDE